jgi:hypothetical protein
MSRALTTSSTVICPLGSDAYPHGYRVLESDREASRPRLHPCVWVAPRPLCRAHQVREYLRIVLVRISNSHLCLRGGLTARASAAARSERSGVRCKRVLGALFQNSPIPSTLALFSISKKKNQPESGNKMPITKSKKISVRRGSNVVLLSKTPLKASTPYVNGNK